MNIEISDYTARNIIIQSLHDAYVNLKASDDYEVDLMREIEILLEYLSSSCCLSYKIYSVELTPESEFEVVSGYLRELYKSLVRYAEPHIEHSIEVVLEYYMTGTEYWKWRGEISK